MNKMNNENKDDHPWIVFLRARMKAITWLTEVRGLNNAEIADNLSMDEMQVYAIKMHIYNENKTPG